MRTTVDLDPDLLERLRLLATKRRISFKHVLNEAIRSGLAAKGTRASAAYVMPSFRMGAVREGLDLDKALSIADALEAAEVAAKLERRK